MLVPGATQKLSRSNAGYADAEVQILRDQLSALQTALRANEQALTCIRGRAEAGMWVPGPAASAFTENLPCLAFLKMANGKYLFVNQLWENLLGLSAAEWYERTDNELWPTAVAAEIRENDRRALATRSPIQAVEVYPTIGGNTTWLMTKFAVEGGDGQDLIGGIGIDITERVFAEQALRVSERRYQEMFERVLTGVYRATPEGTLLIANPALVGMLGYDSLQQIARTRFPNPGIVDALNREDHVAGVETTWQTRTGGFRTFRESVTAVRNADGSLLYYEGVAEDITERKRAELFERDCGHVLEMIATNEPLGAIFDHLAALVERQAPNTFCSAMRASGGQLYIVSPGSLPSGYVKAFENGVSIADGVGSCGTAAYMKTAVVVTDIETDPLWAGYSNLALKYNLRSCWSLPVLGTTGETLGTLAVYAREIRHPEPEDLDILAMAARFAAIAIERKQMDDDLHRQANYDRLTGLPNRARFEDRLHTAIERARESGSKAALLWLGLDRFKGINESLGHPTGDALLVMVGQRLAAALTPAETLARVGGDEFAIIVDTANAAAAEDCARRVLEALKNSFTVSGYEVFISGSVGIGLYPEHGTGREALQRNADAAMYRAKSRGKNRYAIYDAKTADDARERLAIETELRHAIENRELEMFYQPLVDLDRNIRGMEALIRWRHPVRGLLAPAAFIPIAEETGLIVSIGAWAVKEACRQCCEWQEAGKPPIKVAVNVSAMQLYFGDFVQDVRNALSASGLPASYLEVELTESVLMRNSEESTAQMHALRDLGVTVAIDDFGTGYSSLSYLQTLPVDCVKIDRSFLARIPIESAKAVIRAITTLAHGLGLTVVAEGIERQEQMDSLGPLGIDLVQGFLIGRPQPNDLARTLILEMRLSHP